ncbi:hypothetical protein THMIRHAM_21410 [Thiomicrorhabdus immobilis]|uniref:Chalcone isomerase domain-containing protein n=1 Tax=Thiomicrorhabdus immobilis TaxID=2791037 RepID=A0ABN6CZA5_9GAMM|nr:chalcone isomerase family protein [Thiomicrorhabdus immobilis]BCN94356.1 hypothetical protein THMIRHAM_21410 [Thiomicrorhabdus immobilis]
MKLAVYFALSVFGVVFSNGCLANASDSKDVVWQEVSQGKATWLWLDVYNASLYVDGKAERANPQPKLPKDFLADSQPLKLSLCYLQAISPGLFIEGANKVLPKEMSEPLKSEVSRLHQSYQPVKPGDCYELEYTPQIGTQLKLNQIPLFTSKVGGFKALYFGIWLGENPLSEDLKNRLLKNLGT